MRLSSTPTSPTNERPSLIQRRRITGQAPRIRAAQRDLIGYRKITVGDRHWRIVWRVTRDTGGRVVIDIAEVWAVGARSDGEVYAELRERIASAAGAPGISTLNDAVSALARAAWTIDPAVEPVEAPLPEWLVDRLTSRARIPAERVAEMTLEQAVDAWADYTSRLR